MLDRLNHDDNYLKGIVFSDEATFHLLGEFLKQSFRIWGTEKRTSL